MKLLLASLFAVVLGHQALTPSAAPAPAPTTGQQAVLVTGASQGIGRKITERLAAAGYRVFAGARKQRDLEELGAITNVTGVRLDVTVAAEVAAAVETVRGAGLPLFAIVNNAGVAVVDPALSTKDEDLDFQLQVNLYGVFRVTKAFAPLVIAAKGRIVNISSISAFLSDQGTSAYTMSKAAVEGFTNVLAAEFAPQGVAVIAVEPGAYNTNILKPALERSTTKGFEADRSGMKPPDEVAEAVFRSLSDEQPKRRYLVVPEEGQAEETIRAVVDMLVQLNEDHAYTYDRAALIRMLDEALAKARRR